jgi:hypothetical protein
METEQAAPKRTVCSATAPNTAREARALPILSRANQESSQVGIGQIHGDSRTR